MTEFEAIYTQYFDSVYRYVLSLCRDEAVAEDITQEAFYKAMEHLDQFEGKCKLYVWLCQIAKNTLYNYQKKQKKTASESDLDLSALPDTDFEGKFIDRETAWEIHKLLHKLDEPYKEVFSLRVFGELSFSQIGELFAKTDSWARLIFYRAKQSLRRDLDEDIL